MTKLRETKSILAKLLANENITVSHQNVKNSYFNVKDRILVCPIWKEMDGNLYDLLLGHEIGHALNTPQQGWHDAPYQKDGKVMPPIFKDILNVLEDARIEKKIKRRYPGLSRSFFLAYKNLNERNFFNIKELKSYEQLNIVDRINLNNKLGSSLKIPFHSEELWILRDIIELETWEDVETLAWKIFESMEEELDDEDSSSNSNSDSTENVENDVEETSNEMSEDKTDAELNNETEQQSLNLQNEEIVEDNLEQENQDICDGLEYSDTNNQTENAEVEISSSESHQLNIKESIDSVRSMTDKSFREKEKEFISDDGAVYLLELPEENMQNIMMSNEEVMNDLQSFIVRQIKDTESSYYKNRMGYDAVVVKSLKDFNSKNKKVILQILKEFNMKKCAKEYTKTFVTKTGELNMTELFKYKFTNNIFKKLETKNKGKSHGIIIYIDLSSSMQQILGNTLEQMLVLVAFCKMAQIPFDVYGFCNGNYYNRSLIKMNRGKKFNAKSEYEIRVPAINFHLKHLIGSKLSNKDYKRSFNNLVVMVNEFNSKEATENGNFQNDWTEAGFNLHGTPFVETLLTSRKMIKKFKREHNLDIVNVLYLTDGEGNQNSIIYPNQVNLNESTVYFIDKETQIKIKRPKGHHVEQAVITQLIQEVTNCKHIGFYLCDMKLMKDLLFFIKESRENRGLTENEIQQMYKSANQNKFFSCPNIGYDKYFYIRSSRSNIFDDELDITLEMSQETIQNTFSNFQINKRNNRILLSKMAEEIATGL